MASTTVAAAPSGSTTAPPGSRCKGTTITDSRGTNEHGLPFGCYGIFGHNADAPRIVDNDISGTGTGVYLNGGGRLAVVANNQIHDNDVLIRNTPGGDDDYGANGVTFANVSALPGAVATRNVITGNAGPSSDYGVDGGAFEIYSSSNVQILANTIANNENVLETGTSPDGNNPLGDCVGNTFAGNQASGRSAGSALDRSVGLILRCATAMVIDHNTFTEIDWWIYEITTGDKFSSDVIGLAITEQHRQPVPEGLPPGRRPAGRPSWSSTPTGSTSPGRSSPAMPTAPPARTSPTGGPAAARTG